MHRSRRVRLMRKHVLCSLFVEMSFGPGSLGQEDVVGDAVRIELAGQRSLTGAHTHAEASSGPVGSVWIVLEVLGWQSGCCLLVLLEIGHQSLVVALDDGFEYS